MRTARAIAALAMLGGAASLGWAALQGQLSVHIVLVVPVVTGTGPWAALGMLALLAGLVGWFWTAWRPPAGERPPPGGSRQEAGERSPPGTERSRAPEGSRNRSGGIILLGPIPIAWGSDRESLLAVVVAAIVLILVAGAAVWYLSG